MRRATTGAGKSAATAPYPADFIPALRGPWHNASVTTPHPQHPGPPSAMDTSPNLQLAYLMAAQSQKHVTYNEAMRALDALVQQIVLDKDLADPAGLAGRRRSLHRGGASPPAPGRARPARSPPTRMAPGPSIRRARAGSPGWPTRTCSTCMTARTGTCCRWRAVAARRWMRSWGGNVLSVQNTHAGGYSAFTARGSDGREYLAAGYGNPSAAAIFAGRNYIQSWSGRETAAAPVPLLLSCDGAFGRTGSVGGFHFY